MVLRRFPQLQPAAAGTGLVLAAYAVVVEGRTGCRVVDFVRAFTGAEVQEAGAAGRACDASLASLAAGTGDPLLRIVATAHATNPRTPFRAARTAYHALYQPDGYRAMHGVFALARRGREAHAVLRVTQPSRLLATQAPTFVVLGFDRGWYAVDPARGLVLGLNAPIELGVLGEGLLLVSRPTSPRTTLRASPGGRGERMVAPM